MTPPTASFNKLNTPSVSYGSKRDTDLGHEGSSTFFRLVCPDPINTGRRRGLPSVPYLQSLPAGPPQVFDVGTPSADASNMAETKPEQKSVLNVVMVRHLAY